MKRFVEYSKLSKKDKRKADSSKRRLWSDYGLCSPVSRVAVDKKKEQRKYACRQKCL